MNKFKSFMSGWASAFDITGFAFLRDIPDFSGGFERDRQALAGDWRRVGQDIRTAMHQIDREIAHEQK